MRACIRLALALLLGIVLSTRVVAGGAKNFQWTAAVDRSSGIATSLEVSTAPYAYSHESPPPLSTNVRMNTVFATYPHWLATPSVTFGMLIAKRNAKNGSTTIQLRGTDLDILTFARHVSRGKNSILLPITSGLLALRNPSSLSSSRDHSYNGALSFSMKTNQILETRIECGYRPAIAGNPPVSRARSWTYRSTQSLFHAYVMWRFHNHCHDYAAAAAAGSPTTIIAGTTTWHWILFVRISFHVCPCRNSTCQMTNLFRARRRNVTFCHKESNVWLSLYDINGGLQTLSTCVSFPTITTKDNECIY